MADKKKTDSEDDPHPRARTREETVTRADLVAKALELYDLARERETMSGDNCYPAPDITGGCKALDLAGRFLGYLGDGKQITFEQLKKELESMGYELVRKKLKAVK